MPKLSQKMATAIEAAEASQPGGGFEPLKPGRYAVKLHEVTAKETQSGDPSWNVSFSDIHSLDGTEHPGRLFHWFTLPKGAIPKGLSGDERTKAEKAEKRRRGELKAFFAAFDFTTDSDTDEMLGEQCLIDVTVETIRQGARQGEKTNRISGFHSVKDHDANLGVFAGDEDDDEEF